MIEFYVETETS